MSKLNLITSLSLIPTALTPAGVITVNEINGQENWIDPDAKVDLEVKTNNLSLTCKLEQSEAKANDFKVIGIGAWSKGTNYNNRLSCSDLSIPLTFTVQAPMTLLANLGRSGSSIPIDGVQVSWSQELPDYNILYQYVKSSISTWQCSGAGDGGIIGGNGIEPPEVVSKYSIHPATLSSREIETYHRNADAATVDSIVSAYDAAINNNVNYGVQWSVSNNNWCAYTAPAGGPLLCTNNGDNSQSKMIFSINPKGFNLSASLNTPEHIVNVQLTPNGVVSPFDIFYFAYNDGVPEDEYLSEPGYNICAHYSSAGLVVAKSNQTHGKRDHEASFLGGNYSEWWQNSDVSVNCSMNSTFAASIYEPNPLDE